MSDTVVFDGELSLEIPLDGECQAVYNVGTEPVIESLTISENGTYTAEGDGYNPVTVNVPSTSPTEMTYTLTFGDGTTVSLSDLSYIKLLDDIVTEIDADGTTIWTRPDGTVPAEYQQVEYIESTGTQFINTNIPVSSISASDFECKFAITSTDTMILFGARTSEFKQMVVVGGKIRNDWITGNTASYLSSEALTVNTEYTMLQQDGVFSCNGSSRTVTTSTESTVPFALFARMGKYADNDGLPNLEAHMRLYSFIATNGDDQICNFVPCYRISDGEIGLYDIVSGTFFTNAGTGTFIKGADVS